jgi:hypothetical protein
MMHGQQNIKFVHLSVFYLACSVSTGFCCVESFININEKELLKAEIFL